MGCCPCRFHGSDSGTQTDETRTAWWALSCWNHFTSEACFTSAFPCARTSSIARLHDAGQDTHCNASNAFVVFDVRPAPQDATYGAGWWVWDLQGEEAGTRTLSTVEPAGIVAAAGGFRPILGRK